MHAILTLHEQIRTGEILRRPAAAAGDPAGPPTAPGRPR